MAKGQDILQCGDIRPNPRPEDSRLEEDMEEMLNHIGFIEDLCHPPISMETDVTGSDVRMAEADNMPCSDEIAVDWAIPGDSYALLGGNIPTVRHISNPIRMQVADSLATCLLDVVLYKSVNTMSRLMFFPKAILRSPSTKKSEDHY